MLRHLGDLDLEQVAEQRADVDAGKKIARASGSLGGAGVVAELGVVEREIHERGHRQRAAFADQVDSVSRQSAINLQSAIDSASTVPVILSHR